MKRVVTVLAILLGAGVIYYVFTTNDTQSTSVIDKKTTGVKPKNNGFASFFKPATTPAPAVVTPVPTRDPAKMATSEYIAWLKDKDGRVLIDVKPRGLKVYRKLNVTITVMPNGEELYLPDEI